MIGRFLRDASGNFAIAMTVALVPIMGGVALAIDYAELTRQKQATLNALDAAGIATARQIVTGASEEAIVAYATSFFHANLGPVDPDSATLHVTLPSNEFGGGTLKLAAELNYKPYFLPVFQELLGKPQSNNVAYDANTEIRLKNTLEVALVLDNSGSMDRLGSGSGQKRMDLLKQAATQLVETIALQAAQMKQVEKPVQFSLVPFAASVNVGTDNADASWMDTDGRAPYHHENFDWATMPAGRKVVPSLGVHYKVGAGWGIEEGQRVTRFSLFDELRRITDEQETCTGSGSSKTCTTTYTYAPFASWGGCVETRPHPYAYDTTEPSAAEPATLFVPMFAPDETDRRDGSNRAAMGNWWADVTTGSNDAARQRYMPKYFQAAPKGTAAKGMYEGPNGMCSSTPITPLTDVTTEEGLATVKGAIGNMVALGGTDVPEGTAWGWRTLSSTEPFAHGRPENEIGNDKVLIVLTDGENTYYTPNSLGYNDLATNRSIYSNKGYTAKNYPGQTRTRLYMGSTVASSIHSNANFTAAMNQHMNTVCEEAKASGVIVMTVALDLNAANSVQAAAIDSLRSCASDSRFRKDPNNPSKPAKLFWNATGATLSDDFKDIANELSNLRIVG